jgi:hypothetical protein
MCSSHFPFRPLIEVLAILNEKAEEMAVYKGDNSKVLSFAFLKVSLSFIFLLISMVSHGFI